MKERTIDKIIDAAFIFVFLTACVGIICVVASAFEVHAVHNELHEVRQLLENLNDSIYW